MQSRSYTFSLYSHNCYENIDVLFDEYEQCGTPRALIFWQDIKFMSQYKRISYKSLKSTSFVH